MVEITFLRHSCATIYDSLYAAILHSCAMLLSKLRHGHQKNLRHKELLSSPLTITITITVIVIVIVIGIKRNEHGVSSLDNLN